MSGFTAEIDYAAEGRENETKTFTTEHAMRSWLFEQGDTLTQETPSEDDEPKIWRYGVSKHGQPVLTATAQLVQD